MRRYFVNSSDVVDNKVHFQGDVFHHIFDVCRQHVGSEFEVLPEGKGIAYLVKVLNVSKKTADAKIIATREIQPLALPHINLVISVPRFNVFDAVIEKAVELGVYKIYPVFSDFSFVRSSEKISDNKTSRWQKIIVSATQQSGRADLMEIMPAVELKELLEKINLSSKSIGLFSYEGRFAQSINDYLAPYLSQKNEIEEIWLFVGSEGGFSEGEVAKFKQLGLNPVTIGTQVLRVETACIALISVLKYSFGLMR